MKLALHQLSVAILAATLAAAALGDDNAQTTPGADATDEATAESNDATAEAEDDDGPAKAIIELRRRLGANPLEGSRFQDRPSSYERELADRIRKLAEEAERTQGQFRRFDINRSRAPLTPDEELIQVLREAGSRLDNVASRFEFENEFEKADHVRAIAQKLRQEARSHAKNTGGDQRSGKAQRETREKPAEEKRGK